MRTQLTDLVVRNAKPPEKGSATIWDTNLPGLCLRISYAGTRSFCLVKGKERSRKNLGKFPSVSLAQARAKAREILNSGETVSTFSFATARDQFIEQHTGRDSTKKELKRQLTKHAGTIESKALSDIRPAQIDSIIDGLRDRPSECLHFWKAIRAFFRWSVRRRFIDRSPVTDEPPTKEKVGDRVLTDKEVTAIWKATADLSTFSRIVRLLLITGQRRNPIASLHSDWITPDGFLFPASIMKSGKEFLLPITPMAKELLPDRKGILFPARRRETPFSGFGESKADLDKRSGVKEWTLHSLRRTAATNLGKLKVQPHIIQSILAHSWGGITARYNRFDYVDEKRAALLLWECQISTMIGHVQL